VLECNCYLESLLNYIMRHHHEINWITPWLMRHHHENIVELRLNHTNIMFHQSIMHYCSYQFHATFITNHNQLSHTGHMPRSCQTYQLQPINHLTHAYSPNSGFNIVTNPNIWQTSKNKIENRTNAHPRPVLAQAERPRSSESVLSLMRAPSA